jgi:23S rRNA (cytidine1920-2'-O)/16S rRNA (cytidine1409-2'-O)-methyltransferase
VRDPRLRAQAVLAVARSAAALGRRTRAVVASPLPGPSGNVEYFVWLVEHPHGPGEVDGDVSDLVERVVAAGPTGENTGWTSGGCQ